MAATDFPQYLQHAMTAAGYPTAADVGRALGQEVNQNVVSRWLRGEGEPSIEKLRPVANLLRIPLLMMMVRAGMITAEEANLEDQPALRPTIEDDIRARRDLTEERKDLLIRMLAQFTGEPTPRGRA